MTNYRMLEKPSEQPSEVLHVKFFCSPNALKDNSFTELK